MKQRYNIVFICMILIWVLSILSGCGRHRYTEEERNAFFEKSSMKTAYSQQNTSFTPYPEDILEYITLGADLIVQATIQSNGEVGNYPMFDDIENGPTFTCMRYDAVIDELWFGPADAPMQKDHFVLELYGDEEYGAMKVHKDDQVILFLQKVEDENLYYPVASSNGIFIINPPTDSIFALSPRDCVTIYDEEKIESFKDTVEGKLQNFKLNGTDEKFTLGAVGELFETQSTLPE